MFFNEKIENIVRVISGIIEKKQIEDVINYKNYKNYITSMDEFYMKMM